MSPILFFLPREGFYFELWQVAMWLVNLLISLVGAIISGYIILRCGDFNKGYCKPIDFSDDLRRFMIVEYGITLFCFLVTTQSWHPLWVYLIYLPMQLYNIRAWIAKKHIVHFITEEEGKKIVIPIENQYSVKFFYYLFLIAFNASWVFEAIFEMFWN